MVTFLLLALVVVLLLSLVRLTLTLAGMGEAVEELREQLNCGTLNFTIEVKRQFLEALQIKIRITADEVLMTGVLGSTVLKL